MLQQKTFARVMHMSTNNEAWVMVLMEELWARNDRITDLIQQSHSLRSFLTNSWEWSMFGAAWKLSPLLLFPLPYRVLPQHKKMYFCIILVKQNSKRCTNLNFQWLLKLNKFLFFPPFGTIELHAPTSSTQSLSWWGEVGNSLIFQHSPSRGVSLRPHTWNRSEQQLFYLIVLIRIRTRDL